MQDLLPRHSDFKDAPATCPDRSDSGFSAVAAGKTITREQGQRVKSSF